MRRRSVLFVVAIMLLSSIIACESREDSEMENVPETTVLNVGNDKLGGKVQATYECNADVIKEMDIVYNPIADLKEKLGDMEFVEELKQTLFFLSEDTGEPLYEKKGCYLSMCNVYLYNIDENVVANALRCYIFTEDKEEAGELMFYEVNGELQYDISSCAYGSTSDILKILSKAPEATYIILTNGYGHTLVNEDNISSNSEFDIKGDVYHALNYELLGVSYNDIIEDLVWVEFK